MKNRRRKKGVDKKPEEFIQKLSGKERLGDIRPLEDAFGKQLGRRAVQ